MAGNQKQDKAAQILIYNPRGMVIETEDDRGYILSVETAEVGQEEYDYDSASTPPTGSSYISGAVGRRCSPAPTTGTAA